MCLLDVMEQSPFSQRKSQNKTRLLYGYGPSVFCSLALCKFKARLMIVSKVWALWLKRSLSLFFCVHVAVGACAQEAVFVLLAVPKQTIYFKLLLIVDGKQCEYSDIILKESPSKRDWKIFLKNEKKSSYSVMTGKGEVLWSLLLVLTYDEVHIRNNPCYYQQKLDSLFQFNNPEINTWLVCCIFPFPLINFLSKDIPTSWSNLQILPVCLSAFISKYLWNIWNINKAGDE